MKILFRVDSSTKIGTGHVMRCLALAHFLKMRGHESTFISRNFTGNILHTIKSEGFNLVELSDLGNTHSNTDFSFVGKHWLCSSAAEDIDEVKSHIKNDIFDLLVIDHYGIEAEWENLSRTFSNKILVIDDLAHHEHVCEFIFNQNLVPNIFKKYNLRVKSKETKFFLGPQYAILREEFRVLRKRARPRKNLKNIFVFLSGTDPHNITSRIVNVALDSQLSHLAFHFVLNAQNKFKDEMYSKALPSDNIRFYENPESIGQIMLKCDLSIGAGGTVSWERACLGLPSLVITLASNQEESSQELHKEGVVDLLSCYTELNESDVVRKILFYEKNLSKLEEMSLKSYQLVDGKGLERIVEGLCM